MPRVRSSVVEHSAAVRMVPGSNPGVPCFPRARCVRASSCGEVAERSKALRQGRNLFGGVGSNPTLVTFHL